jgi:hypothetical protein
MSNEARVIIEAAPLLNDFWWMTALNCRENEISKAEG